MLSIATLAAFVPAAAAVVVAPGPDTMYTVTRSLGDGRAAGVVAGAGTATGVLLHTAAAVAGLSALLRASALAYTLATYVGAAYLCYLGVRQVRGDGGVEFDASGSTPSLWDAYRRAVAINVTNPKVAVFVLAFFPQFVPAGANATLDLSVLGAVYATMSLLYLGAVAVFAGRIRHLVDGSTRARRAVEYVSGGVLVAFGLHLLVSGRPSA